MTESRDLPIRISKELKDEIENYPMIDWSEVASSAIQEKLILLKKLDVIAQDSQLTEEDAIELGRKINKAALDKYLRKSIKR